MFRSEENSSLFCRAPSSVPHSKLRALELSSAWFFEPWRFADDESLGMESSLFIFCSGPSSFSRERHIDLCERGEVGQDVKRSRARSLRGVPDPLPSPPRRRRRMRKRNGSWPFRSSLLPGSSIVAHERYRESKIRREGYEDTIMCNR